MESLHSYMNAKTFGTCALLLVLTTLPVNTGVKDSPKPRITKRNPSLYFCGCPDLACHIIYNTAYKAGEACNPVALMLKILKLIYFIGLTNQQKRKE